MPIFAGKSAEIFENSRARQSYGYKATTQERARGNIQGKLMIQLKAGRSFVAAFLVASVLYSAVLQAGPQTATKDATKTATKDATKKTKSKDTTKDKDKAPTKEVKLDEGSLDDLKKFIAKQKGKVVVVDLWSTSCIPCMKEFPHLVELSKKYPKRVVCVSFSCDYYGVKSKPPSYYRKNVEKFLKKKKATFKNFLSTTASDDLFDKIKLASIPAVMVFGPDGKLAKRFDNDDLADDAEPFTYKKAVNPLVEKLAKTVKLKKEK